MALTFLHLAMRFAGVVSVATPLVFRRLAAAQGGREQLKRLDRPTRSIALKIAAKCPIFLRNSLYMPVSLSHPFATRHL
jgi:hypothetical protein